MLRSGQNHSRISDVEIAVDRDTREGRPGASRLGSTPNFELTPPGFALLLGLLILAAYPQVVFGLQTFIFRDYGLFGYPIAFYHRECFWRGEIPLWNPLNNCGLPFLAQWNTMTLYPGSLFYLLLPLPWSLGMFGLLHQFLGGLGMFYLARRWTGSSTGATLAGVIFAFNGLMLNCLMWPNNIAGLGWMPWVVLAAEWGWRQGGVRIIQAALVGALQMLTGAPEIIFLTWLVVTAVWLVDLRNMAQLGWMSRINASRNEPDRARHTVAATDSWVTEGRPRLPSVEGAGRSWFVLGRLPAIVLLVIGLSAIQLFPFCDLLLHSQRDTGFAASHGAMPAWGWANLLVPLFHGVRTGQAVILQPDQAWTSSYYLGVATLVLGVWAAVRIRNARVCLLGGLAGLGLILALGDSGYLFAWLRHALPWLNVVQFPIKWVVLTVFSAPLLAGCAAAVLGRQNAETRESTDALDSGIANPASKTPDRTVRRVLMEWTSLGLIAAFLIYLILRFASHYPFAWDDGPATWRNGLERVGFLALMLAVFWFRPWFRRFRRPSLWGIVLLMVHWLDMQTHMPNQNPTANLDVLRPGLSLNSLSPRPVPGQSRAMLSREAHQRLIAVFAPDPAQNYLCSRMGLLANVNLLDGIPKINGFFSLYLRLENEARASLYAPTHRYPEPLMDFLGVTLRTAPGQVFEWQSRTQAMPLATVGQRPVYAKEDVTLRAIVSPQFQPRKEVYLSPELKPFVTVSNTAQATLLAQRWNAHRIELDVEAAEPSLVVIAQAFYHPWQAYVDGSKVPLWRANHAFQALEVPAGRHRVQVRYEDGGFKTGIWVSGVTLAGCAIGWYGRYRRTRRSESL